jgi:hypothetical protein
MYIHIKIRFPLFLPYVQHHLQFCLSPLIYIKMGISSIGETVKSCRGPTQMSRIGEGWQSCFWSKIPQWQTVHCHDATAKVLDEVFAHFCSVTIKCLCSLWNWIFDLPGRFLDLKENYKHSWLCCSPVSHFSALLSLDFFVSALMYGSCFLTRTIV